MYYVSDDVDKALACSFCAKKLADTVSLIPECGSFICGHCYSQLREDEDDDENTKEYRCRACKEEHTLPASGLPDCKQLLNLLKLKPAEKPLSENAKKLKKLIKEVVDQVEKLEVFDGKEIVNEHCDRLELEVSDTVASAVKHLGAIERELLKQISEYRNKCLENLSTLSEDQTASQTALDEETSQVLKALREEIGQFNTEWRGYFSRVETLASESNIDAALSKTDRFKTEMESLEQAMIKQSLLEHPLVFKVNLEFLQQSDHIGEIQSLSGADNTWIQETAHLTLTKHSNWVRQVLFLSDGRLVSCSDDKSIKIWNARSGEELFELLGHKSFVLSLAALSKDVLVSGSGDKTIKVWDLSQRKKIRTFQGHSSSVISLQTLKKLDFASFSNDYTIKIWNLIAKDYKASVALEGHGGSGCKEMFCGNIGFMSLLLYNEHLVTCSHNGNSLNEYVLCIWNLSDQKLVKSVSSGLKAVSSLHVLSNDQIVLGTEIGTIKIIDLTNDALSKTKEKAHESRIFSFAQLFNSKLVSAGKDEPNYTIKVWRLNDLSLLQNIASGHSENILSLCISPDGKFLASGSADKAIKLWSIIAK